MLENIISVSKSIKSQCNIKIKKLNRILSTLPINVNIKSGYTLIPCQVDVFNNDNRTGTEDVSNKKYLISAKIIQIINKVSEIPLSFICCDFKANFFVLSIYSLSKEFKENIKPGFSNIIILEPNLTKFSFTLMDKTYEYTKITVTDLSKFLLDGKYCSIFSSNSESSSTFFS